MNIDLNCNPSVAPTSTSEIECGMPLNYFAWQTPPLGAVQPHRAEPVRPVAPTSQAGTLVSGSVRPVQQTSQTGAMVPVPVTTPSLAPILSSVARDQKMNWRILYRRTLLYRMANHLFCPLCRKMFGMT